MQCFIHKNPIFRKKFLLAGQIIALVNDDFIDYHLFKVTPSGMNETNLEAYVTRKTILVDCENMCKAFLISFIHN